MKGILLKAVAVFCTVLFVQMAFAQDEKANRPSPPAELKFDVGTAKVSIDYSSPAVKGRKIWGDLVPYGIVWRTGANEATVFETSEALLINGEVLPAGRYALFTIPTEKEWTVIFNSVPDQWGAYQYNATKDVLRVTVAPEKGEFNERMQFLYQEASGLILVWENLWLRLNVAQAK